MTRPVVAGPYGLYLFTSFDTNVPVAEGPVNPVFMRSRTLALLVKDIMLTSSRNIYLRSQGFSTM